MRRIPILIIATVALLLLPGLLSATALVTVSSTTTRLCPGTQNADFGALQLTINSGQLNAGEYLMLIFNQEFAGTVTTAPASVTAGPPAVSAGQTTVFLSISATLPTGSSITVSGLKANVPQPPKTVMVTVTGSTVAVSAGVLAIVDADACIGHMALSTESLWFGGPLSTNPPAQTLTISNSTLPGINMGVTFYATPQGQWLSVTPTAEVNGVTTVTVSVDYTNLSPSATYYGTLYINASKADNSGISVPIVARPGRTAQISATPTSLSLKVAVGHNPAQQTLTIKNAGTGGLYPELSAGNSWIQLGTMQGNESSGYTWPVSINSADLPIGTYDGSVTVYSASAFNTGLKIPVQLVVETPTPKIVVAPDAINLTLDVGSTATQTLQITNGGSGDLNWSASVPIDAPWIVLSRGSTTTTAGGAPIHGTAPDTITITLKTVSMTVPGQTYTGKIHLESSSENVTNPTLDIPLTVKLLPRGTSAQHVHLCALPGSTKSVAQTVPLATGGAPFNWTATATGFGGNWLSLGSSSGTTPGNLSIIGNPTGLAGVYTGVVTVSYSGTGAPSDQTIVVDLTVGQPSIDSGGVVNSARTQANGIVPGSIFSIYGWNVAADTKTPAAGATEVPDTLGGATVYFGSVKGRLYYASPRQLNVQAPQELTGSTVQVRVSVAGEGGTYEALSTSLNVITADPGVYTLDGSPTGPAAAANASGVVTTSNPARRGSLLLLYGTALGPVSNPPVTGKLAVADPLSTLLDNNVTVTIGGKVVTPAWVGLGPGFAGLYQINVIVPADVPTGDAVQVKVTANGRDSNVATLPIR